MYSPLTTNTRSMLPCRIQLFATVTPVSIPAQAFEMSNVIAWSAPMASPQRYSSWAPSAAAQAVRSFVMLQLITTSIDAASRCARSRAPIAAVLAKTVGVVLTHRDATFMYSGQPLKIDVRVMACRRHQDRLS